MTTAAVPNRRMLLGTKRSPSDEATLTTPSNHCPKTFLECRDRGRFAAKDVVCARCDQVRR